VDHIGRPCAIGLERRNEYLAFEEEGEIQLTKNSQLLVRHAHVNLVFLLVVGGDGFKFGGWRCSDHSLQRGHFHVIGGPEKERFEILFANASNGIDIGAAAIVFGHITAKGFVNIGAA